MRKKIVSTLLALCMVLSLLPITVFAAELTAAQKAELKAQGYTDEQIENVLIIEEDTVIEADESRLIVIVTPGVTVTVKGATLDTGVIVAPGAVDAKVVIAAESNVNAVVVLDKAEVVLEENAKATYVTVAAAEASVSLSGEAEKVTVGAVAEKASVSVTSSGAVAEMTVAAPEATAEIAGAVTTVTVAETATGASTTVTSTGTVTDVAVAAPSASTEIAGTVTNVAVAETAEGASTTVAASGSVTSVTVDAPNTTVTANGTVENVTVGATATDTSLNGTPGSVTDNSGNVIETNKPADSTPDDIIPGDTTENPYVPMTLQEKVGSGVKPAPLYDNRGSNDLNDLIAGTKDDVFANGLASSYTVTSTKDNERSTATTPVYDVRIVATDLVAHENTAGAVYAWFGISIPVEDGWANTYAKVTYDPETGAPSTETITKTACWEYNDKNYDTFYYAFSAGSKGSVATPADLQVIEVTMTNKGNGEQKKVVLDIDVVIDAVQDAEAPTNSPAAETNPADIIGALADDVDLNQEVVDDVIPPSPSVESGEAPVAP